MLVVTLLSCVSPGAGDPAPLTCFAAGILPNLWSTLRLAGATPLEEEEVGVSEGGNLHFPPRRRRVMGAGFLTGAFFLEGGGLLRTPAYWRTEPSPSLSSSTPTVPETLPTDVCLISPLSSRSRRLNTPEGCKTKTFQLSSDHLIESTDDHKTPISPQRRLFHPPWIRPRVFQTPMRVLNLFCKSTRTNRK